MIYDWILLNYFAVKKDTLIFVSTTKVYNRSKERLNQNSARTELDLN